MPIGQFAVIRGIRASVYENAHVEVRLAERWMDDGHVGGRRN